MSPKKTPIINDFRAGELTPRTDARPDLKDYYRGCRILEGMMPIIEGGVARVPGTYYVRPVKTDEGWNIRITKSGNGTGVVTSDVAGINCGSGCYAFFVDGITVILTATPDAGMSFLAWSGDGTGLVTRSFLMDGNKVVNAEFSSIPLNDYLIGWYKLDEGKESIINNSANPLNPILKWPNLDIIGNIYNFWNAFPGFGTGTSGTYGYKALTTGISFGKIGCIGAFLRFTGKNGTYTRAAFFSDNPTTGTVTSIENILTTYANYGIFISGSGKCGLNNQISYNDAILKWIFQFNIFENNALKCCIVKWDGTLIVGTLTAPEATASAALKYFNLLRGWNNVYYWQGQMGDFLIYNQIYLSLSEWAIWYDQLRSRYGMAARNGW